MKSLVVALSLVPALAHAEPDRSATYSFDLASATRWFGDTSAAIVTPDAMVGVRMTAGRSLLSTDIKHRDVDVGLFARYTYGAASGQMFDALDTDLQQHMLGAGVRADLPLRRWFAVVGQAELGMAYTSLRVDADAMTPADDGHWAPYLQTTLGGELRLTNGKRLDMSLGADVGYIVTKPVELHALPSDRPDEELSIATTFAGIGKLDTRGVTYSLSLRGRF